MSIQYVDIMLSPLRCACCRSDTGIKVASVLNTSKATFKAARFLGEVSGDVIRHIWQTLGKTVYHDTPSICCAECSSKRRDIWWLVQANRVSVPLCKSCTSEKLLRTSFDVVLRVNLTDKNTKAGLQWLRKHGEISPLNDTSTAEKIFSVIFGGI